MSYAGWVEKGSPFLLNDGTGVTRLLIPENAVRREWSWQLGVDRFWLSKQQGVRKPPTPAHSHTPGLELGVIFSLPFVSKSRAWAPRIEHGYSAGIIALQLYHLPTKRQP